MIKNIQNDNKHKHTTKKQTHQKPIKPKPKTIENKNNNKQ